MGLVANSIAPVRLTVCDIERSRQFYESVFNWPVLLEIPENADEKMRRQLGFLFGGVIYDMGGALIGLRPVAVDRTSFFAHAVSKNVNINPDPYIFVHFSSTLYRKTQKKTSAPLVHWENQAGQFKNHLSVDPHDSY
jgi:hypothetical protein